MTRRVEIELDDDVAEYAEQQPENAAQDLRLGRLRRQGAELSAAQQAQRNADALREQAASRGVHIDPARAARFRALRQPHPDTEAVAAELLASWR